MCRPRGYGGAACTEKPHDGRLRILDFGVGHAQLLQHIDTGEVIALAGGWTLEFVDGCGLLGPLDSRPGAEPREPTWTNEFLHLSLHGVSAADGGEQVVVYDDRNKVRTPIAHHRNKMQATTFIRDLPEGNLRAELYVHPAPIEGVGMVRFWTMPYLQHALFGEASTSRCVCKNYDTFVGALAFLCSLCLMFGSVPWGFRSGSGGVNTSCGGMLRQTVTRDAALTNNGVFAYQQVWRGLGLFVATCRIHKCDGP